MASSTPRDTAVFTLLRWVPAQGRLAFPLPLAAPADYRSPPGFGGAVFTSIVVGTDGSAPAREAVRVAVEMARLCAARLHVVSAYRVFGDMVLVAPGLDEKAPGEAATEERIRADVEAMLRRLAQELEADGVAVTTYASSDNPAQAILDVADRERADLIVVGNRGLATPGASGACPTTSCNSPRVRFSSPTPGL
jgi:nucleotide-binding universal stress UspA family protein